MSKVMYAAENVVSSRLHAVYRSWCACTLSCTRSYGILSDILVASVVCEAGLVASAFYHCGGRPPLSGAPA